MIASVSAKLFPVLSTIIGVVAVKNAVNMPVQLSNIFPILYAINMERRDRSIGTYPIYSSNVMDGTNL